MTQKIIYSVDSLGVFHPETIEKADWSISQLFMQGGPAGMTVITLFLIALFIAAWKAPRWVKEIGIGALVFSVFWTLKDLYQIFGFIEMYDDLSRGVTCGGLRVAMISLFYGIIVYFVSLVIRIIQKPRI
ncbi:MAG: hypothetical protein IJK05_09400 [Bacteroidales bacterium]|nr:hypothetical protein [Bacteroidales bacterium]